MYERSKLRIHAPTPNPRDLTIELDGKPLYGVSRISFDLEAGRFPVIVRLELTADSFEFTADAVRILADAGAEFARTVDDTDRREHQPAPMPDTDPGEDFPAIAPPER